MAKKVPGENPFEALLATPSPVAPGPVPAGPVPTGPAASGAEKGEKAGTSGAGSEERRRARRTPARSRRSKVDVDRDVDGGPVLGTRVSETRAEVDERERRGPRGGKIILLQNGRTRKNVYVDKELWDRVTAHARGRMSQSDVVELALRAYLGDE